MLEIINKIVWFSLCAVLGYYTGTGLYVLIDHIFKFD